MLHRALLLLLMTHLALAAPVPTNDFARQEVSRVVKLMERERLVTFSRAGTLMLASPSAQITEACEALGASAVEPLAEAFLAARTDGVRYGIGVALAARGAAGEKALVKLLQNPALKGRRWLLQGLGGHTSGPIVAALRQLLRDPDHELAERAVLDLAESEDDAGLVLLRGVLRSPDRALAKKAALALAFQKDHTGVEILLTDLREAKGGALSLFQTMKGLGLSGAASAVAPLVNTFAANAAHVEAGEPPGRVTGLADFEARFRRMPVSERAMLIAGSASGALAGLSHRAPRPEVVPLLTHANPAVRRMALEVLGACGDASTAPAVMRVIETGQKHQPSRAGGEAGRRGELGRALPPDGDEGEDAWREAELVTAAQTLRNIAASATRAPLSAALRRAHGPLAGWIALALAALDDPEGVRRAVQLARGEGDIALAAITTLGSSTVPEAVEHLSSVMELGEPQMQLLAASSMSRPGNVHARRPLARLLARGREADDAQVVGVAALGLGLVGDAAAVKPLEELLTHQDRSVRRAAVVGLWYLTGEARRYVNVWGEEVRFEPTTFHVKLRQETMANASKSRPVDDSK